MNRKQVAIRCSIILLLSLHPVRAQVSQVWAVTFNGPASDADYAYAMTIDASGNMYVAGESRTGATTTDSIDYAVVKFDPNGDTVWGRFYNGTANKRDMVRAIAVDDSGNVYVTGESYGTSDYDIATVKYNASGVQQWAMRYNGPADGADGASAIAVDSAGNVYITGYSDGDASPVFRQDDYVTIKYNAAGVGLWSKRYDGPGGFHDIPHAISVDSSGYVYVTGQSSGSGGTRYNYATIKYNSAGDTVWVRGYNGPIDYDEVAYALKVDKAGNVYVTGSSDGTSSSNEDYVTIKYDASGTQQWLARYDGPGGGDDAFAMALDESGKLFVTGESRGPGPTFSYDYLTVRYNSSTGDTIWTARYDGDGNGFDATVSIAADNMGNVFVTGYSTGNSTGLDIATVGYDSAGSQRWVQRFASNGSNADVGSAVAADASGFVYVGGTTYGGTQLNNFIAIKYHETGPSGVEGNFNAIPGRIELSQNYPNPFNPITTINYILPQRYQVSLRVFDMLGRAVATLVDQVEEPGNKSVMLDASRLTSGVYYYRLQVGEHIEAKKLLLLR